MKPFFALLGLILLCGCGYRYDGQDKVSVCVPYVVGDFEGELTDAIIEALSQTANFRYTRGDGDWILKANVKGAKNDRIGYRRDRRDKSGKRRRNVIGTENRQAISVEISIVNATTGKLILGPQTIRADADYDYVDPNSLQDLSFIDPATGNRTTSIAFSLGQLDSVGSAGQDAIYPIYKRLAQKIVDGMIASSDEKNE